MVTMWRFSYSKQNGGWTAVKTNKISAAVTQTRRSAVHSVLRLDSTLVWSSHKGSSVDGCGQSSCAESVQTSDTFTKTYWACNIGAEIPWKFFNTPINFQHTNIFVTLLSSYDVTWLLSKYHQYQRHVLEAFINCSPKETNRHIIIIQHIKCSIT